jgi:hypothetical protein
MTRKAQSTHNGGSLTADQAQGLLDVNFSKRGALVLIFLFKECGYLSATLVITGVLLALLGCALCSLLSS